MLKLPPLNYPKLFKLVTCYNRLNTDEHIKKLFLLQQIDYEINNHEVDFELFNWLYDTDEKNSWHQQLKDYGINQYASIFLKGFQFAHAVAKHAAGKHQIKTSIPSQNFRKFDEIDYANRHERDEILRQSSLDDHIIEQYININLTLNELAQKNPHLKKRITHANRILEQSQDKINSIILTRMTLIPLKQAIPRKHWANSEIIKTLYIPLIMKNLLSE